MVVEIEIERAGGGRKEVKGASGGGGGKKRTKKKGAKRKKGKDAGKRGEKVKEMIGVDPCHHGGVKGE